MLSARSAVAMMVAVWATVHASIVAADGNGVIFFGDDWQRASCTGTQHPIRLEVLQGPSSDSQPIHPRVQISADGFASVARLLKAHGRPFAGCQDFDAEGSGNLFAIVHYPDLRFAPGPKMLSVISARDRLGLVE